MGYYTLDFYSNFNEGNGVYSGDIDCSASGLTSENLVQFTPLLEIHGNFSLASNALINMDELIRLKKVTQTVDIHNNINLTNIFGLSNVVGNSGQILRIDDTGQYINKADISKNFCLSNWNLYNGLINISDDKEKICY